VGGYGFLLRSEFFFRTTQELEYLFCFQNLTLCYNVCKPVVYLYTNARGRVIYVSALFHATLYMIFVANLKYI
jgi:hypothetical protein